MNPWLERRVLHFAHQGGELEAPSNTLYAFKTAVAKGAHALEMDVHATADGELIVCHDPDADRTTNGTGFWDALTIGQIKALDCAHWFSPGLDSPRDAKDFPLRGIATGDREPPAGFSANDFRVPTFREVLEAFPDTFLNMDIKRSAPETRPYQEAVAALLHEFGRVDDVIVASFADETIARFREIAPDVTTAAAAGETYSLWGREGTPPGEAPYEAIQAPWELGGRDVVTPERMDAARKLGVAVHIWTVNDEDVMRRLIDLGVDGIMTSRPTLLARVLNGLGERDG